MNLFRIIFLLLVVVATGFGLQFLPDIWQPPRDFTIIQGADETNDDAIVKALQKLTPDDVEALRQREIDYLARHPLDEKSLQNFAILHALGGNSASTSELNLLLARYSLRNIGVQLIAINTLVAKGDFDEAMFRLDASLRSAPEIQPQLFPTIAALTENKSALPAVAKTLSNQPPWRKNYMVHIAKAEPSGQLTYKLLKAMHDRGGDLQHEELRNILSVWVQTGQIEKAYFVWLDLLPPDELKSLKLIYDGEFNREARSQFFDWTLGAKKNVRISISRKPGSSVDRALLLDFFGYKGNFNQVSQMLRLSDGRYDINYEVMSQNFKSEGGLLWRVHCFDVTTQAPNVIGTSTSVIDSVPWTSSTFTIEVPPEGCDTQILRLESKAKTGLDTVVNGQIFFDDFKVERKENDTAQ